MLVSIEGCPGVGKSTLVRLLAQFLACAPVYEAAERNPFLEDFYHAQDRGSLARHVQHTFLFLQEWQLRQALPLSARGELVICDFHPLKSLVFGKVILPAREQEALTDLYHSLPIPQPDLLIYLKAEEPTILSRLRKRQDQQIPGLDFTYITQVCSAYDAFFRSYTGRFLAIDTSHLDYYERPQDIGVPLRSLQEALDLLSSSRPRSARRTAHQRVPGG